MNFDDANRLAIRYKNIWRGGPATEELREHLTEMDATRAERAFTELAQTCDFPPTIAHIWRQYENTRGPLTYGWQQPDYTEAVDLNDYLTHLRTRTDPDATDELDIWRRKIGKP